MCPLSLFIKSFSTDIGKITDTDRVHKKVQPDYIFQNTFNITNLTQKQFYFMYRLQIIFVFLFFFLYYLSVIYILTGVDTRCQRMQSPDPRATIKYVFNYNKYIPDKSTTDLLFTIRTVNTIRRYQRIQTEDCVT